MSAMQTPKPIPIKATAGAIPRREARSPVPAIGVAIKADFLDGSTIHTGRLWDVSSSGACLWFPSQQFNGPQAPQSEGQGQVVIHHPSDPVTISVEARLAWVDIQPRATYVGFEFLERNDFSNTFLRLLIRG